jgi:hypothetical protein
VLSVDWKRIKAEYIAGGTSYRKLAEKYGVPRTNLERRAKEEKWTELRRQAEGKAEAKMVDAISEKQAAKADKIIDVADKLLNKIAEVIDLVSDTQGLKHISSALKDIKDIKGFKSSADMREQEARIRNLEKQAQAEDNESNEIKVTIEGDLDIYSK